MYGAPHPDLAEVGAGARQFSPLVPGAEALEAAADGALARMVIAAPPGVLERRYVLAQALRVLEPGGELIAMASKTRGGARLRAELESFGCDVAERGARHQRLCVAARPGTPTDLEAAITQGGPQLASALELWSQPGIFSWDRLDPGSALLIEHLGHLAGRGADLGCGIGLLSLRILASPAVTALAAIDLDRRAVAAAARNLAGDARAQVSQHDLRQPPPDLAGLNFVIMNPPFHDGGLEDRNLGQAFIQRASALLRKGGVLRMVANIGMPYEAVLAEAFARVKPLRQAQGYKLFEAVR